MAGRAACGRQEEFATMIRLRDLARVGAALFALAAPAAAADDIDHVSPGIARSTSFLALSPDAAVTVRPLDNTRANLALKQHFAAALKKRAVRVEETAAVYVLNFETEVDQAIKRPASSLGSGSGTSRDSEVRINVWASHRDSVLRGPAGDQMDRGTLRYVLTATLEDERTGRRLWQGEASYAGAPADEATTLAAMASVLADQLGRTVRQKNFRLE
jgi:hypothetical protein